MVDIDPRLYRKEYPPSVTKTNLIEVKVNITIISIGAIGELDMTFNAKLNLHLEW